MYKNCFGRVYMFISSNCMVFSILEDFFWSISYIIVFSIFAAIISFFLWTSIMGDPQLHRSSFSLPGGLGIWTFSQWGSGYSEGHEVLHKIPPGSSECRYVHLRWINLFTTEATELIATPKLYNSHTSFSKIIYRPTSEIFLSSCHLVFSSSYLSISSTVLQTISLLSE